jgi:hypothetical protein
LFCDDASAHSWRLPQNRPPLPPGVSGTYWALVLIRGPSGLQYRYVVVDADARPEHPIEEPDEPPPATPKRT